MAKEGRRALSREHSLLGLRTWLAGVGKADSDGTGDAETSLGHTVPISFMPLLLKGTISNDEIWGHWGTALIYSEGSALDGGRSLV